jgi:hypothetical protein
MLWSQQLGRPRQEVQLIPGVPDQLGQQDHTSRPAHKYKKRKIIREKLSRFCLSLAIKLRRLSKHKFKVNMPDY